MEGVGVALFFKSYDLSIQLLDFLFLAKQLVLLLLEKLLSVDYLFVDLAVAGLSPLEFFLIHVAVPFEFEDECFVPTLTLLFFVELVLQLCQPFIDAIFDSLQFRSG